MLTFMIQFLLLLYHHNSSLCQNGLWFPLISENFDHKKCYLHHFRLVICNRWRNDISRSCRSIVVVDKYSSPGQLKNMNTLRPAMAKCGETPSLYEKDPPLILTFIWWSYSQSDSNHLEYPLTVWVAHFEVFFLIVQGIMRAICPLPNSMKLTRSRALKGLRDWVLG